MAQTNDTTPVQASLQSGLPEQASLQAAAANETTESSNNTTFSSSEKHDVENEASPKLDPHESKRSALETFVLMATLCSAVFLAALDITIVSTALPTISKYFDSASGYTWVGSAFLLAAAVVSPSWSKFSDIFGRKPILLVAIAIFFLGSALCGAAVSIGMLIVGRAIQGSAGGGLMSLASIVVADLFSPRERGKFYAFLGLIWAVAFVLGPLIGGAFTENVSWRWCFYINLPVSGTAFFIILFLLKLETPKTPILKGIRIIDWGGSLLLIGGLLMLLFGLVFGGVTFPWNSVTVICLIVFGIVTLVLFFVYEGHVARYPIVPLHIYSNVSNLAVAAVTLFHGIVLTTNTYFLPLYCQSVLGASPILSGVLLLPFAVFMSVALVGSGRYMKRTGRALDCVRLGFAFMTLGSGLYYDLPDGEYWPKIVLYQLIAGFGIGLDFQPPMIALQNNIPPQDNGSATASFGLVRNVASAIGVVIGSAIFSNQITNQQGAILAAVGPSTAELFTPANAQANVESINNLTAAQQSVVRTAYFTSIRTIWLVSVSFSAAALVVCFLIHPKKLERKYTEVKTGLEAEEERRRAAQALKNAGKQQLTDPATNA